MQYDLTVAEAYPDFTVAITWSDRVHGVVDFMPYITKRGVFAPLQDPDFFVREMRVLRAGIGLTWPNKIYFSADGLRREAFPGTTWRGT